MGNRGCIETQIEMRSEDNLKEIVRVQRVLQGIGGSALKPASLAPL